MTQIDKLNQIYREPNEWDYINLTDKVNELAETVNHLLKENKKLSDRIESLEIHHIIFGG